MQAPDDAACDGATNSPEAPVAEPRADASCQGGAAPAAGAQALSARKQRRCYRYGNYRGYYGYRVGAEMEDHRLLSLRREWFEGRRCIDVGCNEGLVSLTLAVRFRTASFLGVDIDGALVHNAHLKLRRLQRAAAEAAAHVGAAPPGERVPEELASLAAAAPALTATQYRRANFLDLELPPASADTIVCLSVSKWVHLNWGDAGLLRLFERCHELLAPGGLLVLEPQPWKSYRQALRKQDMPPDVVQHYKSIKLRPEDAREILLQRTGFDGVEELRESTRRGFDRPLLLCRKACAVADAAAVGDARPSSHDAAPSPPRSNTV